MLIGLFTHLEWHWSWPKIWPMIDGAAAAAKAAGARLLILDEPSSGWQAESNSVLQLRAEYTQRRELIDGFVSVFPNDEFARYAASLHASGTPVVLIGRKSGAVPRVLVDNFQAYREATHSLLARGHRDILFFAGPNGNLCSSERLRGHLQALADEGLSFNENLLLKCEFSEELARKRLKVLLETGVSITAVLATNDQMGTGVIEVLSEMGYRVPEDIEVIGFDNITSALWCRPALSTYEMHAHELGACAVRACIDAINGKAVASEYIIPASFVARGSTRNSAETKNDQGLERPQVFGTRENVIESRVSAEILDLANTVETAGGSKEIITGSLRRLSENYLESMGQRHRADAYFESATLRLRELPFHQPTEPEILEELRLAFANLGVSRLGALVVSEPSALEAQSRWYLNGHYTEGGDSDAMKLRQFLESAHGVSSLLFVPLQYERERFGFIVVEADSPYATRFWELIRDFSAALYSLRLIKTLRANRELEQATKAATAARAEAERSYIALKASQEELLRTQSKLVESSRLAGIGEMARTVLHNIGNLLNSINTSAGVVQEQVESFKINELTRVAEMLNTHRTDVGNFLSQDPRGKHVIDYLMGLAEAFRKRKDDCTVEIGTTREQIEQLNSLVAAQSEYASARASVENVSLRESLEIALRLTAHRLEELGVVVENSVSPLTQVLAAGHRILQILVSAIVAAAEWIKTFGDAPRLEISTETSENLEVLLIFFLPKIPEATIKDAFSMNSARLNGAGGLTLHDSANAAGEFGGRLYIEQNADAKKSSLILRLPKGTVVKPTE